MGPALAEGVEGEPSTGLGPPSEDAWRIKAVAPKGVLREQQRQQQQKAVAWNDVAASAVHRLGVADVVVDGCWSQK